MNNKIAITVLGILITVIIIFSFLGEISPNIVESSNAAGYGSNCSLYGGTYEFDPLISDTNCTLSATNNDTGLPASFSTLPMLSLFRSGGVILVIVMLAIFLGVFLLVKRFKK